ncbi:hypothetical protein BU26DRAFT_571529 [Trematosphaeria pertusa]|uniref:Uncharacterized protein n=1 Tax=Trematosphaeria pertusa TaxID=390896 RepID=A0A6A6HUU6_9PLEO|nr:uncharacterized protein BU26DRAFT_571529 [Trematosphaeria pertusa]KAF2241781.1 hypothetical protein BU26DRAFT_571529 [Trematosphaeria pertusa]
MHPVFAIDSERRICRTELILMIAALYALEYIAQGAKKTAWNWQWRERTARPEGVDARVPYLPCTRSQHAMQHESATKALSVAKQEFKRGSTLSCINSDELESGGKNPTHKTPSTRKQPRIRPSPSAHVPNPPARDPPNHQEHGSLPAWLDADQRTPATRSTLRFLL